MAVWPNDVVDVARSYLGTPYLHQGRTRCGLDCVGLVIRVVHDLGLSDYDVDHYGRVPSGYYMRQVLTEHCDAIRPARDAGVGAVVHLRYFREPQHLAIVTDVGIIHASNDRGVVEHRFVEDDQRRVRGAYRLPGVHT